MKRSPGDPVPILRRMTRARGLTLTRINPEEDLLLPPLSGTPPPEDILSSYRKLLDHYALRLLLKEIIKNGDAHTWEKGRRSVEKFCDPKAMDGFLKQLSNLGIVQSGPSGVPLPRIRIHSFGPTYEWYVARVLSEDFHCPSGWGARFGGTETGGDHDVIADLSGRFLYVEVKTAPPRHVEAPEINAFIHRLLDLAPDLAVFHEDTHLRMKDKIVPLMEEAIRRTKGPGSRSRGINSRKPVFERLEREIFHLDGLIYIVNSKPDLRRNLEIVFRHHFRRHSPVRSKILGEGT